MLILYVLRAVFVLKTPVDSVITRISEHELERYYIILNEKMDI